MLSFSTSDLETRLVVTYLAQSVLGLILFFVFNHFSKIYIRRFLKSWSRSWFAFSIYMLCSALLIVVMRHDQYRAFNLPLSFIAQVGCFSQIVLILIGTYQLVYFKPLKKRTHFWILLLSIFLALAMVLIFSHNTQATLERYVLRVGSRTFISGLGFLFASAVVWTNPQFSRGMGQRFLALSLFFFSIDQFFYLYIVLCNVFGEPFPVPAIFGLVDLLLIAMVGISMVMWLLEDEREKLNKANKELDSFLYSTSHDLRAPIASIMGLTYLGKIELEEEKARHFMELIEERVKKLDMVISDILSLSRTKKFEVKIEEINFNKLLDESIIDVKFSKGASSISLRYERDANPVFQSDYHQMKMVLNNLIANAVKYHRLDQPDPYIQVVFQNTGERVEIVVADNGRGIPAESLSKIFDMFYRASEDTEGTGLGLYIVKEALEKIKGTITVESEFGKGSRFTVMLENPDTEQ